MDPFSLEDEDCNELFITQEPSQKGGNDNFILGDGHDFVSPMWSLLDLKYSDISEDEFELPSSQLNLPHER